MTEDQRIKTKPGGGGGGGGGGRDIYILNKEAATALTLFEIMKTIRRLGGEGETDDLDGEKWSE